MQAEQGVAASLACMAESALKSECKNVATKFEQVNLFSSYNFFSAFVITNISFYIFFSWQCPLLNISYCPPTEVNLSGGKKLVSAVF